MTASSRAGTARNNSALDRGEDRSRVARLARPFRPAGPRPFGRPPAPSSRPIDGGGPSAHNRHMFDNPAGPTVGTRSVDLLERELAAALDSERRADCMARIQTDAVQLALDLAVRETDIDGFFRAFIKTLVEECESRACAVWLLQDDGSRSEPWMAYANGEFHAGDAAGMGRRGAAARGHGRAPHRARGRMAGDGRVPGWTTSGCRRACAPSTRRTGSSRCRWRR